MGRLVTQAARGFVRRVGHAFVMLVGAGVITATAASAGDAQVRRDTTARRDTTVRRDTTQRDTTARRDTTRAPGDTLQRDSTSKFQVEWATPDSTMEALLAREGYVVTKYQGDRVELLAKDRTIRLIGKAAVGRPEAVLVGDTVTYNDSLDIVTAAAGDTAHVILQDPTGAQDDIVAKRIRYEVANRRGLAYDVTTAVESGQRWVVHGKITGFLNDSSEAKRNAFYAREGWITSCTETAPHYHFASREMKVVSKDVMVARPAVLYIGDIPVFWLPFVFQDLRSGRRSGIIPPRFGVSDIVRNSPDYRRTIEDLGYYFALSDYFDAQVALDWRSSAGAEPGDPGWTRYKGSFDYRWLNRFLSGGIDVSFLKQSDGQVNRTYSWSHDQQFSQRSRLSMNLNYASSTSLQRQNTFNPWSALATIDSRLNYQQQIGSFQLGIGGSRKQYPGRDQVDQDVPNLNVASKPINLGSWLTWTPSFQLGNRQSIKIDQPPLLYAYTQSSSGVGIDSVVVNRSTRQTQAAFDTPIKIGEFTWTNSFRYSDNLNDFPYTKIVVDPADSSKKQSITFERDFATTLDWTTGITLPSFFQGTWKLSPSVSFQNVDPKPFFYRSQFSNGKFAQQKKRVVWSLSSAPTLFGLFPGFGPVERFRHSIAPTFSYSYAAKSSVSDDYLRATNQTRQGYIGAFAQNLVSLSLSTNLEGKLRAESDSVPDEAKRKIKLVSLSFTPLEYDFQRAKETGRSGFVTERFGYTVRSDLLPGFDFGVDYSLFRGSPRTSDTAEFSPYREAIRGSLSLNRESGIVAAIARFFGYDLRGQVQNTPTAAAATRDSAAVRSIASQKIAGSVNTANRMNEQFMTGTGGGWQVDLTYSSQRFRPVEGAIEVDPQAQCAYLQNVDPFAYDQCIQKYTTAPGVQDPFAPTTGGGQIYQSPPTQNVQASTRFNITPKWAMQWSTNYDFVAQEFGMHTVSLRRELHDWDAIFAFTQSPNGNFAFNFFIALRAQPELKFNYDRRSYRRTPGGFQ